MIDFGCIHNGLPRRVHVWFDVDPEESWKAGDRGCLSKSRRDRDPRTGRMGAPRAVKTGLHTADFRADDFRRYVYKLRGVATPEESSMHDN